MTRQMADDEVLATLDLAANDINALSFSETGRDWPYKADLAEARAAVAALQAERDADKAALEALRGQVAGLVAAADSITFDMYELTAPETRAAFDGRDSVAVVRIDTLDAFRTELRAIKERMG